MSSAWIKQIGLFILLVVLQVGLFDKIHLFGYATPLLYIYFIIGLPIDLNRNAVITLSAAMGFGIDLLTYTLGINMLACVIVGFLRHYFLKLLAPRDVFESYSPSFGSLGEASFLRYAGLMVLIHQIVLFTAESFSLFDLLTLAYRIAGSFILTMLLIVAFEYINSRGHRK